MSINVSNIKLKNIFELSKEAALNSFYERMITIPITAISSLKRELSRTVGEDRSKGIFIRYGWHNGVSDGEIAMTFQWENELELINTGPKLHKLHGYLDEVKVNDIKYDIEENLKYINASWLNSFEVDEFLKSGNHSDQPVCHILCGYTSGYLSTVLKKPILVKETKCGAMGDEKCEVICMPMEKWSEELESEYKYYQSTSMVQELDEMTEKYKQQRDTLNKAYEIHRKLVEELLSKRGLQRIADVLSRTTGLPMFIENEYFEQQVKGYCSFLFLDGSIPNDLEYMIIDQAALTSSIVLLNENVKINTEQNIRRGFLSDVLERRLEKEEIYKIAYFLKFNPNNLFWMLTIETNIKRSDIHPQIEINEELVQHINSFFTDRNIDTIVTQQSGKIVMLIDYPSFEELLMKQSKFIRELLKHCSRRFSNYNFLAGVSSVVEKIEKAPTLYEETLAALKAKSSRQQIYYFEDLGIESVLFQIPDESLIDRFVEKQVGELLEVDKNFELVKTLYAYIENGLNINNTAKAISMSISGLRYRLFKISEALNIDLDDTKSVFSVYMALNVLKAKGKIKF